MTAPLETAIEMVDTYGLAVFPLAEHSKVPAVEGGRNSHTQDVDSLRSFMSKRPNCNYGIATGEDAGNLFVIDCDVDNDKGEDGIATVRAWESSHGAFPEGPIVTTPRGGMHLYFYADRPINCSTNAELGVDIRGNGGYVVGAGSSLENGDYEWDFDIADYAIPNADDNVYAFLSHVQKGKTGGIQKFELPETIKPGERNDTLYKYACSLRAYSADESIILASVMGVNAIMCKPPMSQGEVEKIVASACTHDAGKSEDIKVRGNVGKMLARRSNGSVIPTIDNCMVVLNNDTRLAGHFGYDVTGYVKTVTLPLPWDNGSGMRAVKDVDYTQLAAWLERNYYLSAKSAAIDAVANVCFENQYNPIIEWLDSLEWDGQDRIPQLLPIFLGAEQNDYNTEVMRLFMRAACARISVPGIKFDSMIVLVGAQGIGKSQFLRLLAHDSRWFDDNFNTVDGDAAVERLRGMWIVEMAELLAAKRTQAVESIKAFVTSTVDSIRPKYAKETEQRPRICVFAGTTNDWQFLSDPTGNRRFLPIACNAKKASAALYDDGAREFIDMCWAQAWDDWKNGDKSLILPNELLEQAEGARALHMEDDPRVGIIQGYLDGLLETQRPEEIRVCVSELLERALDMKDAKTPQKKVTKEIHQIMANMPGWKRYDKNASGKTRTPYGIQVCYVPIVSLTETDLGQQTLE